MRAKRTDGRLSSRPSASPERTAGELGVRSLGTSPRGSHLLFAPPGPPVARPLLVYFHGAGGRAEQGLPLLRDLASDLGVLVLMPTSAASTWDMVSGQPGPDVQALDDALTEVFAGHVVDRAAFAGFSDGASYALSLGLANGDLADAVLAFSPGFAAPPRQVGAPRVWLSHGTDDAVLPIERCGRRVHRMLRDAGYDVRLEEFEGAHVVPASCVEAALTWWLDASP